MILQRKDLIYPELSYQIIGAAFNVYNQLGWGRKELDYQNALARELKILNLPFDREKLFRLEYKGEIIGRHKPDFVVDGKVVIELKVVSRLGYTHIRQVMPYLKISNLKLAILIYFTRDGVKYRRVVNSYIV